MRGEWLRRGQRGGDFGQRRRVAVVVVVADDDAGATAGKRARRSASSLASLPVQVNIAVSSGSANVAVRRSA